MDPPAQIELEGVAALADRPVDGRRVALVMSAVGIVLAALCALAMEALLAGANAEPSAARSLRAHASVGPAATLPPSHVAVVLIDGMRTDEAPALASWRSLTPASVTGTIALPTPTLSRPFYHLLFTGVPQHASGVRTNRFAERARLDSVTDRVRDAGGSVVFVSEGLDWMRRMHGRPGDGGSDDARSLESLAPHLDAWRAAPAPALLVVHVTSTDGSAHHEGVRSAAHRRALERADRVIAQVAERAPSLVVLSDHGHRDAGGHGGPEPEVATAPLLARRPGLAPAVIDVPLRATRLAPTIAAWLGVEAPRSALSGSSEALAGPSHDRSETALLASLAQQGRAADRLARLDRQRWLVPLAFLLALLTLGPIKRAYRFDRATPIALFGWPLVVLGVHLALDRPLSLSAIDTKLAHGVRIALIGGLSALAVFALARLAGHSGVASARRAAASIGWSAAASALFACAWVGLSLGAWPLDPLELYLPLLALGAGAPALVTMALVLAVTARSRSLGPP